MSGRGAYWLGALFGLIFSGSLAAVLSLATPVPDRAVAVGTPAMAPGAEETSTQADESGDEAPASPIASQPESPEAPEPATTEAESEPAAAGTTAPETEPEADGTQSATEETAATAETPPATDASASDDEASVAAQTPAAEPQSDATADAAEAPVTEPTASEAGESAGGDAAEAESEVAAEAAAEPAVDGDATSLEAPVEAERDPAGEEEVALLAPASPAPVSEAETPAAPAAPGLPPFQANAEIYNGDRSQPLLAIVLTEPSGGFDTDALDDLLLLPGPLAVVIEAEGADRAETVADLRDAGFESLLGLEVGDAGDASGVAAMLDAVPQILAVAALGDGFTANAPSEALIAAAGAGGYGLLDASTPGGGVAFRLSRVANVPAAANGRRFDEAPTSNLVFLSLERAASDARRLGAFVVMAESSPAVMTGLRRWMNLKANKSVAVAPLSTVMEKIAKR